MSQLDTGTSYAFPVEDFIQTLTAQLDRAQDALALKAKTGRPLTFALKDLSIDLNVFWQVRNDGRLVMKHAAPNEEGASTVHLSFTTITRSMVEENTFSLGLEEDPRSINDLAGSDTLKDEDKRRLELVGVRTVGQFRRMSEGTDPKQMEAFLGIPVNRLRAALAKSARPAVVEHSVVSGPDKRKLLRIRGANLMKEEAPQVRIAGTPVEVIEASPSELLVKPLSYQREGQFEIQVADEVATGFFEIPADNQHVQEDPYATEFNRLEAVQ